MAVTVKIADKKKPVKPKKGDAPVVKETGLEDYLLPQEALEGKKALGFWLLIMAFLCLPCWVNSDLYPWATGMTLWGLIPSLLYLFVLPQIVVRRLRTQGAEASIDEKTNPRVKKLMEKASGILGIREPEGFFETDGQPRIFPLPGALIVRKGAMAFLEPDEVNCLVVRALVHEREAQARRLAVIQLIADTQKTVKLLMWPVVIYTKLLRAMWYPHAQKNADRIALLLIKNPKLMVSAIVKEYAANDPNMQEMEIATQDVTNWINQSGHIGMAGEEISTQYKLGRAIHEDPELEDRLQALQRWADAPEFKIALQKLTEAVRKA